MAPICFLYSGADRTQPVLLGQWHAYFFWVFEKLLVGGIITYVCMSFLRLKSGAERIAAGDYNTKVSTDHLVLEFKTTAETLE